MSIYLNSLQTNSGSKFFGNVNLRTFTGGPKDLGPGPLENQGYLFVCFAVLRPSQPNGVMSSMVSLPNHMFTVSG